jgi:hypothetical protein
MEESFRSVHKYWELLSIILGNTNTRFKGEKWAVLQKGKKARKHPGLKEKDCAGSKRIFEEFWKHYSWRAGSRINLNLLQAFRFQTHAP